MNLSEIFISPAYAQAAGGGGGGGDLFIQLMPFILIFAVFYFFIIRPQQKRAKAHREALSNIRRSDRIITNGGLVGTVTKVNDDDDMLTVEVADNVRVQIVRSMVAEVRAKGEPITAKASNDKKDEAKKDDAKKDDEKKS